MALSFRLSPVKILDALAGSHRSLLLIGGTGAGKSVTECYLLTQLFRRNPKNSTWAISVKNDSFCGLDRKGRVVLFDRKKVEEAFDALDCVHGIYSETQPNCVLCHSSRADRHIH